MGATRRSQPWWEEYRERPYLEHFDYDELNRRFDYLVANALQRTASDGRIGASMQEEWLRRLTHAKAELNARGLLPNHGRVGEDSQIPDGADPAAADAISGVELPDDEPYLVKYGEARYVRPVAERGEIRVSPATRMDDPSLNPAQRDEELHLRTTAHPDEVRIRTADGETIEPVGNVDFTRSATTDFYVWSLSSVLDVRLFRAFGGDDGDEDDACLLIRDPETFLRRLRSGLRDELPGWEIREGWVEYVDPTHPPEEEPTVYFAKHFRHAYEREVRVIAVPPEDVDRLDEYVCLELGPCDDVGEVVEVPRDGRTAAR